MGGQVERKPGELWKVKELAAAWRVSPGMVYTWIARGDIAVIRTPGGRVRIPADEVRRLLTYSLGDSQVFPLTQAPGGGV